MEYGICILGTIPLRNEANDQSEIVSQVLFGQHFKILEIKPKWIKIKLATDNYEGWICAKQYEEITYEDYDNLCINDFPLVGSIFTRIQKLNSKESIPISMGATLPFFNNGIVKISNKFKLDRLSIVSCILLSLSFAPSIFCNLDIRFILFFLLSIYIALANCNFLVFMSNRLF